MKEEEKDLLFKAVCSYLPYGLKLYFEYTKKVGLITAIYNIDEDIKFSMDYGDDEHIWMFKPLLRPLSQIETYFKNLYEKDGYINDYLCEEYLSRFDYYIDGLHNVRLEYLPYGTVQCLLEHHFDLFGLIELGLATEITN